LATAMDPRASGMDVPAASTVMPIATGGTFSTQLPPTKTHKLCIRCCVRCCIRYCIRRVIDAHRYRRHLQYAPATHKVCIRCCVRRCIRYCIKRVIDAHRCWRTFSTHLPPIKCVLGAVFDTVLDV
jgi:hypothetical protein